MAAGPHRCVIPDQEHWPIHDVPVRWEFPSAQLRPGWPRGSMASISPTWMEDSESRELVNSESRGRVRGHVVSHGTDLSHFGRDARFLS